MHTPYDEMDAEGFLRTTVLIARKASSRRLGVRLPPAQSPAGTHNRPLADGPVTVDPHLLSVLVPLVLEACLRREDEGRLLNEPFSTISPTNTFEKPATIWATGIDTC
jgi:hypothetical protein